MFYITKYTRLECFSYATEDTDEAAETYEKARKEVEENHKKKENDYNDVMGVVLRNDNHAFLWQFW